MFRDEIEGIILAEGFEIHQRRWLQLAPEQVSDFYSDDYGREDFAKLVAYMSSGPILVLAIARTNAIEEWKMLMGPAKVV